MQDADMDADEENLLTDVHHDWQEDRLALGLDNASIQAAAGWLNQQRTTVEIPQDWSVQYNPADLNPEQRRAFDHVMGLVRGQTPPQTARTGTTSWFISWERQALASLR